MTRILPVLLVTNFLHAAETIYVDHSYTIMTSLVKSAERREAYAVLFGDEGEIVYYRHSQDPWSVREEIMKLKERVRNNPDSEKKMAACNKILLLFPK